MKKLFAVLAVSLFLLASCGGRTPKTQEASDTKTESCCSDSTKKCCSGEGDHKCANDSTKHECTKDKEKCAEGKEAGSECAKKTE